MTLTFTVLGHPQPAGSKKAFAIRKNGVPTGKVAVTDDAKGSRDWKQQVAGAACEALVEATEGDRFAPLLDGPLSVRFEFFVARPKGHYGTGRNAHIVKASAPEFPAVKPDVDKLSRAVMDALSGVVYRDDAQVVRKSVTKQYGAPERVEITVYELEPMRWEQATRDRAA